MWRNLRATVACVGALAITFLSGCATDQGASPTAASATSGAAAPSPSNSSSGSTTGEGGTRILVSGRDLSIAGAPVCVDGGQDNIGVVANDNDPSGRMAIRHMMLQIDNSTNVADEVGIAFNPDPGKLDTGYQSWCYDASSVPPEGKASVQRDGMSFAIIGSVRPPLPDGSQSFDPNGQTVPFEIHLTCPSIQ